MKKFFVFHLNQKETVKDKDLYWKVTFRAEIPSTEFIKENYNVVAAVSAEDLDKVYRLTNTIDYFWTENSEIIKAVSDRIRSTSVGDIVFDDEQKTWHMVKNSGWGDITHIAPSITEFRNDFWDFV